MLTVPQKRRVVRNVSVLSVMLLARLLGTACLRRDVCKFKVSTTGSFLQLVGGVTFESSRCLKRNFSSTPLENWTDISIKELKAMIQAKNIQLFDVREPHELVQIGSIPCSTNIPLQKVPEAFTMDPQEFEDEYGAKKPDKNDANIVFHCLAGVRSKAAMEAVHQIGYTKARHYPGGFDEWASFSDVCKEKSRDY